MSVVYFTKDGTSYSPTWKSYDCPNLSSAGVEFWTGTGKIVLTDLFVGLTNAGTFVLKYGRAASSSIIFWGASQGSAGISTNFQTPFAGDRDNGNLYLEGGPGVGEAVLSAAGFELL